MITSKLVMLELNKVWADIGQWSEGLCSVLDKTSGMWGYVDKTGEYVINPGYYEALPFSEGLEVVKGADGYYCFINKLGQTVITGEYINIWSRFRSDLKGFKYGLAAVEVKKDNKSTIVLIDTKGNTVKELEGDTQYTIQMNRFINKGEIIVSSDDSRNTYDKEYNIISTLSGSYEGHRVLYNYSKKYSVYDEMDYKGIGLGLYIVTSNGTKVFEQSQVKGMDNSYTWDIGVTDDYIVVQRNINSIQTQAVYDFNGNVVIDFKYKQVMPIAKDLFVVQNNAGTVAIIDSKEKELVPFSLGLSNFARTSQFNVLYEHVQSLGAVDFITKDKNGNEKAQYFDIKTRQIKDYFFLNLKGYKLNASEFKYQTQDKVFHICEGKNTSTLYGSAGEKMRDISYYFSSGSFKYISSKELFLEAGVIPIVKLDKNNYQALL